VITPLAFRALERDVVVYRKLWWSSLTTYFLMPLLFLGAMGLGLGGLVDERTGDVEGMRYLVFVAPGILAAGAMQSGAAESLWPVLGGMKWIRHFHGMVASPMGPADVLFGRLSWTAVRTVVSSTVFLAVAALLGAIPSPWAVVAVPFAVLSALSFAAPLAAFSATQQDDFAFPVIMRLGIIPLFLFSGVFFPLEQLPEGLRRLAVVSPLYHSVELCRAATTGTLEALPVLGHLAVLVLFVVVGALVGVRTFTRRLCP
jgi:lipooligosaccharide transport system permease protein